MNRIWIQSALASLIILSAFNVYAVNCEEQSPNLLADGEAYYNLEENLALTGEEKAAITKMFSVFKRRLEGNGVVVECIKNNDRHEQITKPEEFTANVTVQSDGVIVIALGVYHPQQKTSFDEIREYLDAKSTFILQELTADKITVVTKYRRVNGQSKSSLHEELTVMTINNKTLSLQTTLYINGYFGQSRTISLHQ